MVRVVEIGEAVAVRVICNSCYQSTSGPLDEFKGEDGEELDLCPNCMSDIPIVSHLIDEVMARIAYFYSQEEVY